MGSINPEDLMDKKSRQLAKLGLEIRFDNDLFASQNYPEEGFDWVRGDKSTFLERMRKQDPIQFELYKDGELFAQSDDSMFLESMETSTTDVLFAWINESLNTMAMRSRYAPLPVAMQAQP